jgi:anti-anti-sigma factor
MLTRIKGKKTILIPADLDKNTLSSFYGELDHLVRELPNEIVLDCSSLHHITSNHIGALWQAYIRCQQAGISLRLSSVKCGLERVLRMLDLYDLLVHRESPAERGETDTAWLPELQLKFKATVPGINDALEKFRDFLMRLNLAELSAFDLETVFYEVATNIRLHGRLNENDSVGFTATQMPGKISLRFTDPGQSFDPTNQMSTLNPREAYSKKQRRGLGLTMIKRMVDTISYQRVEDGFNVLSLEKKLDKAGGIER